MVCLDTDFIIDLIRQKEEAKIKLANLVSAGENLCTTIITIAELYKGVYKNKSRQRISNVERIIDSMKILPFTKQSAETFGKLYYNESINKSRPGDMDLLIASISLTHKETFLTRNTRHFTVIPNLHMDTW